MQRCERYWQRALEVSERAREEGDLIPLQTDQLVLPELDPFRVRELLSRTPRHLRPDGPRPNPFLPWEPPLEVARPAPGHVLLLNKYPVQSAHLLLITQGWQPQNGWLQSADWQALAVVAADTGGLWFFNSCAEAGASQPHRHLQLLPRHAGEASCPLAPLLQAQLEDGDRPWTWPYRLSPRQQGLEPAAAAMELAGIYRDHSHQLGLGDLSADPAPRHPYNLLIDDHWLLTVRRRREHCAGFSVNALGFAGYLLRTRRSDLDWLKEHGPWQLLAAVAGCGAT